MTPEQIKANFQAKGVNVGKWADERGFPRNLVYRLLNGRSPGLRGRHHDAAVALGIKPNPNQPTQ